MFKNRFKKFTLIETIVFLIVIATFAGLATPQFVKIQKNAKIDKMRLDLDVLGKAVNVYKSNNKYYPFVKEDDSYKRIDIEKPTLRDALNNIGDDGSEVYQIDIDKLNSYVNESEYTILKQSPYLYSTKSKVAIFEKGEFDKDENPYYLMK